MSTAATLSAHLRRWATELAGTSDSPRLDAEILFRHASGWSEVEILLRDRETPHPSIVARVDSLVQQRAQGHPIAYLTGEREFYSLPLHVSHEVLIPRPETELLVELALAFIEARPDARVLDLGTGSGAIALAIAANAPQSRVLATDINPQSLDLAAANASTLKLDNISFLLSDWFTQLGRQRFDLIVSNPPYIDPADPHLEQGDVRFEPRRALVAEEHGMSDIRRIVSSAPLHLDKGGLLALEHGYEQGDATRLLMNEAGLVNVRTRKDLNQLDRVSSASVK